MRVACELQPNPEDPGTPLGVAVMESRGLFPYAYWYWIGIGGLVGFYVLFNVAFTLSLGFMPGESPSHRVNVVALIRRLLHPVTKLHGYFEMSQLLRHVVQFLGD